MLHDGRQPAQSWHGNWNFKLTISQSKTLEFLESLCLFDIASTYRDKHARSVVSHSRSLKATTTSQSRRCLPAFPGWCAIQAACRCGCAPGKNTKERFVVQLTSSETWAFEFKQGSHLPGQRKTQGWSPAPSMPMETDSLAETAGSRYVVVCSCFFFFVVLG
jgi:hypothetical protein